MKLNDDQLAQLRDEGWIFMPDYFSAEEVAILKAEADDRKGLYCAVSAYNTGAGNVSRVFTGKRRISAALPLIKKYKADDLYAKLVKELPYEETRHYLRKVIGRMPLYVQGG